VPPGLTKVQILDYHISTYVNIEADIYFPEDEGVVQIENFGVHVCHDGTVTLNAHLQSLFLSLASRCVVVLIFCVCE